MCRTGTCCKCHSLTAPLASPSVIDVRPPSRVPCKASSTGVDVSDSWPPGSLPDQLIMVVTIPSQESQVVLGRVNCEP